MIGLQTLAWITDPWTYLIVGLVALLLFGKRLPEVGRSWGGALRNSRKACTTCRMRSACLVFLLECGS